MTTVRRIDRSRVLSTEYRAPQSQRGFTLLEILVVVVIIGVLVTFATLSIGDRALEDRMEVEAKRLEKILQLALEEAEIKGVELGFRHTEEGYEFLTIGEEGKWQRLEATGLLRPRAVPDPFYLELRVEGRAVPPADIPEGKDKDKTIEPQVFLLSSGEVSTFSLAVKAPQLRHYYQVDADALGRFTLARQDEDA